MSGTEALILSGIILLSLSVLAMISPRAFRLALRLLLNVCEVPAQRPGGQQVIIQHPVVLLQINSPPLPVNANGAFFFGR